MIEEQYPSGSILGGSEVLKNRGVMGLAGRYDVRTPTGEERTVGVLDISNPAIGKHLEGLGLHTLRHPNLVEFVAVTTAGRRAAIVTEQLRGITLRERMAQGPISDALALAWTRGMLEGLAAAHHRGMFHRDLRPETILVEGDRLQILDLGIPSAILALMSAGGSVTTSGTTVGRPHYWAPERARRPRSADARSDLFSVGCIVYELFAGVGPFDGLNLYDCYHATLESRYPPLAERRRTLPPHVGAAVTAMLRAKPEERPSSAQEVLHILEGGRSSVSVSSMPPNRMDPPPVPGVVSRAPALVAGGVILALLVALAIAVAL